MMFARLIFFVLKAAFTLGGGLWGLAGAAYICESILKIDSVNGSLLPMLVLGTIGLGAGSAAGVFLLALPMMFIFPKAQKQFSWEKRDPSFVCRFYQWYGKNIEKFAYQREHDAP